ncbi:hypothetical protein Lal_00049258, partial [Lupinus albus]
WYSRASYDRSIQTPREVVGGFGSDACDVLAVHSNGLRSHTCLVFPWMRCMRRTWADQFVPLSPFDLSVPLNDTLPWCRSCLTIRGGNTGTWNKVVDGCYLVDPASSHMLVSKIKPCMCNLFDGIYYSDNRSNSRANTCNKPRLLEGMHLLDKRSTQALPVALMIHDNSSDRTAFEPATHHSNFCPINFRWVRFRRGSLRNGYHIQGRQQARKLPNPDTGRIHWRASLVPAAALVVGPWVGSIGPPLVCTGRLVPSAGDALLALTGRVVPPALRTTAKAFAKDVFINQERKLGARRRSDTVLVSTINDADQGSADVAFRTPLAPYEKSKSLGSGGSMVARLKLKGIDGRAPPGVEPAA